MIRPINESRWFKEGEEAKRRGEMLEHCPYAEVSPKWYIWKEGFSS